jgi:hypothetical protein
MHGDCQVAAALAAIPDLGEHGGPSDLPELVVVCLIRSLQLAATGPLA